MALSAILVAVYHGYGGKADVCEELQGMTLILAATNGKEIVVGADTFVYEGAIGENAYRTYTVPKLFLVNDGRWVIAFSGSGGPAKNIWEYMEAKGQKFNQDIKIGILECTRCVGEILAEFRLTTEAHALLAGFSGTEPRICTWNVGLPAIQGGAFPKSNGIGCGTNLGLYVLDTCKPFETLSREQLISAVYFGISEVVRSGEPRVRKPIDIAVITADGAMILPRDSLAVYEEKSHRLAQLIRAAL